MVYSQLTLFSPSTSHAEHPPGRFFRAGTDVTPYRTRGCAAWSWRTGDFSDGPGRLARELLYSNGERAKGGAVEGGAMMVAVLVGIVLLECILHRIPDDWRPERLTRRP